MLAYDEMPEIFIFADTDDMIKFNPRIKFVDVILQFLVLMQKLIAENY